MHFAAVAALAKTAAPLHILARGQTDEGSVCMNVIDDKFIRIDGVVERTGRSRAAIYRMIAEGSFPRQERIGVRAVGWRLSAILRWMEAPTEYREQ